MGVTYKLTDEVIHFIIGQRQSNPLSSCRQLAESASQKFGLRLSKSSVHDVLKESGIVTPRGRKPKEKFKIPQEKKKQIQSSLSQIKLISPPVITEQTKETVTTTTPPITNEISLMADIVEPQKAQEPTLIKTIEPPKIEPPKKEELEISAEYEGAGKIFLKAALWDLGIFSEENIKATDWSYFLTYSKGIKVVLENKQDIFIDLPLPIERCIRETADGLINNVKPLIVCKVSDEKLFKACMEAQTGCKIENISIVDEKDHILFELSSIVELKRMFMIENRVFVDSDEKNILERAKIIFFSQIVNNNNFIEEIMNIKGFDATNNEENTITLLIENSYVNKVLLHEAVDKLNGMFLRDEQNRQVKVKIQTMTQEETKSNLSQDVNSDTSNVLNDQTNSPQNSQ